MGNPRIIEGSCRSSATPAQAWAVWTEPDAWPGGPIAAAKLHGAFEVGGTITTKVKGFPAGTSTITRVESPTLWVGVAKSPGVTMTYEHVIDPVEGGTLLTERAILSGPLAGLVARVLRRRLEQAFAATTAHCAQLAESRA